jgi:glutamine synthetase
MQQELPDELRKLAHDHPQVRYVEALLVDVNGIVRGKRIALEEAAALWGRGINLPGALHLLDMRGRNIEGLRIGTDDGDPDMISRAVPGTLAMTPWLEHPIAQCLLGMYMPTGEPWFADSRHVLAAVYRHYRERGLSVVAAVEMEFYLLADDDGPLPELRIGRIPGTQTLHTGPQLFNIEDLHELDGFLHELNAACRAQQLPASTAISECAPGQFEINLHHVDGPLRACDHAVLLRRAIRGVARRHGMAATFMAKPFAEFSGSGSHVHVSVYDRDGRNFFAPVVAGEPFAPALRHAVGGLVAVMPESMAFFCPNANSYRRLRPGAFAPIYANWGLNHRNVAIRIPASDAMNLRIEHRVAGADANPYLATAAILAGMLHGMEHRIEPPRMIAEGETIHPEKLLPNRWEAALDALEGARTLPPYLGERFCNVYAQARRTESEQFHAQVSHLDYEWYLRVL